MPNQPSPQSKLDEHRAGSAESVAKRSDVALVESWQAVKKSFAFALKADDFQSGWMDRFSKSAGRIQELTEQDADIALYMMLQAATNDTENYSASHAIFCAVVANLCSGYFEWPAAEAVALHNAALTMNIGMVLLQDSMSQQAGPLSPAQRLLIAAHPARSVEILELVGVSDPLWLETVRRHHCPVDEGEACDPLSDCQRLAQLLQRIDVFTAKLSKRKTRPGSTSTVAARDACLDKSGLPDATGATMLRVLGLYPPGSFVRLASGEVGVVIRRGAKAHTPVVACVRRENGATITPPRVRDTSNAVHAVQCSFSAQDVNIRLNHEQVIGVG